MFEGADRYNSKVSWILIDIDSYKNINDRFGHPADDLVLQEIGDILVKLEQCCNIVNRHGGDKFSIILPETAGTFTKVLVPAVALSLILD